MTGHSVLTPRGRPLLVFATLAAIWIAVRMLTWESPFPLAAPNSAASPILAENGAGASGPLPVEAALSQNEAVVYGRALTRGPVRNPTPWARASLPLSPTDFDALAPNMPRSETATWQGGHQLLYLAGMSYLPVPSGVGHRSGVTAGNSPAGISASTDRLSADVWAFWREGSGSEAISQGRAASYGASQIGAVMRYRLRPSDSHDPQGYIRAYRALVRNGETELAAGLSARPLASVPLRLHTEIRVREAGGEFDYRSSAFVTTQLPPVKLPFETRAEVYAQAGYVGGDDATAFADGQTHILHDISRSGETYLAAGMGAWAGAQKGTARVDIGPSARLDLDIGAAPARLSVDYRMRISGNAEPGSGVALTLSSRF